MLLTVAIIEQDADRRVVCRSPVPQDHVKDHVKIPQTAPTRCKPALTASTARRGAWRPDRAGPDRCPISESSGSLVGMATSTNTPSPGTPGAVSQRVKMPEFFVVGHHKCGTSALWEMLRRHPEIYMPEVKETWYFAPELRSPKKRQPGPERPETLEQYLALFENARSDQRVGENSPVYLMSKQAPTLIAEAQPDARIIAILREPASFLRSFHLQCLRNYVETEKDFGRAISLEPLRREGKAIPRYSHRPHELLYSDHVKYVEQLQTYEAVFPRERILVLIYEDYRQDNEGTLRKVLRFLDVDDSLPLELIEANPSFSVRSPQLNEMVRSVYIGRGPVSRAVKAGVKSVTTTSLRMQMLRLTQRRVMYGAPGRSDDEVMLELRRRYRGEVEAISQHLDRDLVSLWGYDELD
jgi:Sulfotransferase family